MKVPYRFPALLMGAVTVLLTGFAARAAVAGQFKVGQRWVYSHEGPRPGAMEPNAVDGQRVLQVVSRTEQAGQTRWMIQERFTGDPNVVGHLSVDDAGLLHSLDLVNAEGEAMRLMYESAIPYQALDIVIGEQKTQETKLVGADGKFSVAMTVKVRRLNDESVVTDAGRFEACRHFEFVTQSSIDMKLVKIPILETRHRWVSDQVQGLVKERYEKSPGKFMTWSWEGYSATSTLASFGLGPVDPNTVVSMTSAQTQSSRPGGTTRFLKKTKILGGLLVCVCAAIVIRAVRRRRRSPA